MNLRPELAQLLTVATPPPSTMSVTEFRQLTMPDSSILGEPESIENVTDTFIAGTSAYLPLRIYRPESFNGSALIYFHGGGWVIGTPDAYEQTLRSLANKTGSMVFAVSYQKAPEHPFPIPFNDCWNTFEWVIHHAERFQIKPSRIGIGGDSAGGNLAAAVALKNREELSAPLAYQLLIYPCTLDHVETLSGRERSQGWGLTSEAMNWFIEQYVPQSNQRKNPYAFPANASDFSNLPPAIIMTAEFDPLKDDGKMYADKLISGGTKVIYKNFEDLNHGSLMRAGVSQCSVELQQYFADQIALFIS